VGASVARGGFTDRAARRTSNPPAATAWLGRSSLVDGTEPDERVARALANAAVRVGEGRRDRGHRRPVTDPTEPPQRGSANRLAWKADQPDERRHAVDRPKPPERTRGRFAEDRVPVGRNVDQCGERDCVSAAERDDGLACEQLVGAAPLGDLAEDPLLDGTASA
jgi:hypothetical protein